jgi:2-polyprenyl-3-methyl-5-hydroxy-6-metoxy-1,4-benzoquinol methylase
MSNSFKKKYLINSNYSKVTVTTEILKACPLCESTNIKKWCKGYDRLHLISLQEFTYSKCNSCDLVFLSVRPLESEIHKFYPTDYGPYHGVNYIEKGEKVHFQPKRYFSTFVKKILLAISKLFNPVIKKIFPERFSIKFSSYYTPPKANLKLLDYGCGSDSFLNQAKALGWETLGMDFTMQPIEKVRQSGHKAILYTSLESWKEIEDESLDFVRMNHVLEHLYNPKEVISMLKQKMKKGAILHIAIPNPGGVSAMIFKNKWRGLECPRHIMLYEIITKDFARSYGFYKHGKKLISHYEIEKQADNQEYAKILYIFARLASALSMSDRFHTFAVK